jgi:hypothetical protein
MPISGLGWELLIERLALHGNGQQVRTYGRYCLFVDGRRAGLDGFMCESAGPGDNVTPESGRRIAVGTYPLYSQFGQYRSTGYSTSRIAGEPPLPALRLADRGTRVGILIHPAYPPKAKLYLASVGCLNPAGPLAPDEDNEFWDSRARTIALLDSLIGFAPAPFAAGRNTMVPDAMVVIEGEP